jgi:hypothetical protein
LLNIINMIRNHPVTRTYLEKITRQTAMDMIYYLSQDPPDGAAMAVEQEITQLFDQENLDQTLAEANKTFCALLAEAHHRKLKNLYTTKS